MSRSLLIYDDSRPGFDAVGDVLARADADIEPVPWQSEHVQSFLEAQFDDRPFAFIFVDGGSVHVGEDAVERLLERGGVGESVRRVVTRVYPPFSAPFGRLVHGQEPADLHGTFPLVEEARDHLDRIRQRYTIPVDQE